MSQCTAFTFLADVDLEQLRERVVAVSGWPWIRRENDRYGDYHSATPGPEGAIVRLIEDGGRYVFDIEFRGTEKDQRGEFESMRARVRDHLLPAIGARDVQQVEGYGR